MATASTQALAAGGGVHRLALLPIDNLSGSAAPLREMYSELSTELSARGLDFLDTAAVDALLARHRIRYTGGIDLPLASALRTDENVAAALVLNLELYDDSATPKLSIMARLVSTASPPEILWMESFSRTGHEAPGLFEQGIITDPAALRKNVFTSVADSLSRFLAGNGRRPLLPRDIPPRISFGRETIADGMPLVGVLPFFNESTRKYANDIMLLHFVQRLHASGKFRAVEPGLIREKMLAMRVIMKDGVSVNQADLIANNLLTDYVLSGRVFNYQDVQGVAEAPYVDFSAQLIERQSKRVIWTSKSYNRGDEGVWFYDWHRIHTANRLAGSMVQSVVQRMGTLATSTRTK